MQQPPQKARQPQQRPPQQQQQRKPAYPTPQTTSHRVVSRSARFWRYLYTDPKARLLLLAAVIGTVYFVVKIVDAFLLYSSLRALGESIENAVPELIGEGVRRNFFAQLPLVHYLALTAAVLLNWLAYFLRRPWTALAAAVLYLVCGVAYIRWAIFVLPSLALTLIAYMALVRRNNTWL